MRSNIPMGEYRLPALNEFTITVTDYTKPPREEISWDDFCDRFDFPDYEVVDHHKLVMKSMKDPNLTVIMPENDPPYEIIWAKP